MRLIAFILLCALPASAVNVQLWTSFESGSDGTTNDLAALESATVKVSGLGYWTNTGINRLVTKTGNINLPGDVTVGTVPGADIGTRKVLYTAETYTNYNRFIFTNPTNNAVSAGCWLSFNASSAFTFGTFDLFGLVGNGGEFISANLDDKPGAQYALAVHTKAGGSTKIGLATNGTYWVSLLWTNGGNAQLGVYNTSLALVGSTNIALDDTQCWWVNIGRWDAHAVSNDSRFYYDNLIVSTNGAWPLLPSTSHVATVYYVNQSAAGANTGLSWANAWPDITNAAIYALPGDTILVTNGTYQNVVSPLYDGRSDGRIKWVAKGSSRAAVKTVGWWVTNDYHSVVGFDVSHTNIAGTQDYSLVRVSTAAGVEILDNAIHDSETSGDYGIAISDSTDTVVRGNDIWNTDYPDGPLYTSAGAACISIGTFNAPSTNGVFEYNWTSYASDHHNGYGPGNIIRNAVMGPIDDSTEAHVDGWQANQDMPGTLMESCTQYQSRDPGGEGVHYILNSDPITQSIFRGSIIVDGNGYFLFDEVSTNLAFYHNTLVNAQYPSGTDVLVASNSTLEARNNIWHTSTTANGAVYGTTTGGAVSTDYDLVYPASTGYSSTNSVESDPLLVSTNNSAPDFRIGSSSSARNSSGGITFTTASGSGSSSLPVANIYRFVVGDWIYVSNAGPAKITARAVTSGSAGTFTLNTNLTWSSGDAVRWSTPSGVRYSDIGAFPFSASVTNRTATYQTNETSVTVTANFEARMAVLYSDDGIPGTPIVAPDAFTWSTNRFSKIRVYPWFPAYGPTTRWVDASLPSTNAASYNAGTVRVSSLRVLQ